MVADLVPLPLAPLDLVVGAVAAVVVNPLLVLAHECGHAVVAASRRPGFVGVRVGARRPLVTFELGRFVIGLHPVVPPWGRTGFCVWDRRRETRLDALLIALAGPVLEITCGALAWGAFRHAGGGHLVRTWFVVTAGLALVSGITSLVPWTREVAHGKPVRSDGAVALDAVRGRLT